MTKPRARRWTAWVGGGSIAMAALAVVSLGATVFVAQRALTEASDVIVRGEGDALLRTLVADLTEDGAVPTATDLAVELEAQSARGVRYLAISDREGAHLQAEAGDARMAGAVPRPGQSTVQGKRVRIAGPLLTRRPRPPGAAGEPPPPRGPRPDRALAGAVLVVEFEPPVIEKLKADLTRISVVAALAGSVLLAFAIAWSRSAKRLAEIEQRAAREQRLVALGGMSSVMAHELRNPLASLKGHAQLLAEDLPDGKQRTKAERVVSEAERLELLTTSLLDFVRDGPIELAEITPAELVAASLEHLAASRVDIDHALATRALRVDRLRLARALHNVIDNALQATPEGDKVELRITQENGETRISVRDHGAGLPAGSEAHIFEPFMTTRVRGTGLGLAVARRIAEQHGGTLTGENHPSGGAVFRLHLPDAPGDA